MRQRLQHEQERNPDVGVLKTGDPAFDFELIQEAAVVQMFFDHPCTGDLNIARLITCIDGLAEEMFLIATFGVHLAQSCNLFAIPIFCL